MAKCPYCNQPFPTGAAVQKVSNKTNEPDIWILSCPNKECDKYLGAVVAPG